MLKKIQETSDFIRKQYATKPQFGIILGTGLGALVNEITIEHSIDYEDLPNFPVSTVESHKGRLIFGKLGDKQVVVMQGRFHTYEGYSMKEVTFPVRVMRNLGIGKLIVSNAAGGLNPSYELSDLMVLEDHIDLFSGNPLVGEHFEELGERFVDMSEPYSFEMIDKALEIAKRNNITVQKDNSFTGTDISVYSLSDSNFDFGGGSLGSVGGNAFNVNWFDVGTDIKAQGNYWDTNIFIDTSTGGV